MNANKIKMRHLFVSRVSRFSWAFFDKFSLFDYVAIFLVKRAERRRILSYFADPKMSIHPSVQMGDVTLKNNIIIDEGTYINSGQIFSGNKCFVKIGKFCALGYGVHIKGESHDINQPTALCHNEPLKHVEASIVIGDHVWIGDNVFIRHGVSVGDYAVIGASSVVLKDIPPFAVAAGIPARIIRIRSERSGK